MGFGASSWEGFRLAVRENGAQGDELRGCCSRKLLEHLIFPWVVARPGQCLLYFCSTYFILVSLTHGMVLSRIQETEDSKQVGMLVLSEVSLRVWIIFEFILLGPTQLL